jgi:hypothetical protein
MQTIQKTIENIRYIVFLIDSKSTTHDGLIFTDIKEARDYAIECYKDKFCDKIAIGMFCIDLMAKNIRIAAVETIGFGKKKNYTQLELFNNF